MNIKISTVQFLDCGVLHWGQRMERKELARVSKALSDPTRLQIYEGIAGCKEMFCGQVVEKYGLTPGTISHHLKILADANLIETRRVHLFEIFARDDSRLCTGVGEDGGQEKSRQLALTA
jgi:ArsR family transcriptional regulator